MKALGLGFRVFRHLDEGRLVGLDGGHDLRGGGPHGEAHRRAAARDADLALGRRNLALRNRKHSWKQLPAAEPANSEGVGMFLQMPQQNAAAALSGCSARKHPCADEFRRTQMLLYAASTCRAPSEPALFGCGVRV